MDIFDTEYKSNNPKDSFFGGAAFGNDHSDMSSLSANAVTHSGSGAHYEHDFDNLDYGIGMPPAITPDNRSSITSNHAGYGAFRAASEPQKPAMAARAQQPATQYQQQHAPKQGSRLRSEVNYGASCGGYESPYTAPAVQEHDSVLLERESIYGGVTQTYGGAR